MPFSMKLVKTTNKMFHDFYGWNCFERFIARWLIDRLWRVFVVRRVDLLRHFLYECNWVGYGNLIFLWNFSGTNVWKNKIDCTLEKIHVVLFRFWYMSLTGLRDAPEIIYWSVIGDWRVNELRNWSGIFIISWLF